MQTDRRLAEMVQAIRARTEKEIRRLLECIHHLPADQCQHCLGKTAQGYRAEEVLEELRAQGLVTVELTEGPPQKTTPHSLKTVIGLGIGVTAFVGLFAWQGGKLVLRLVRKAQDTKKA